MPIITKPASIEKAVAANFTLDKSALAAVASVAADTYYSDSSNWKEVFLYYNSSTGSQREILKFDATVASPSTDFLASAKALNIFEIQKIVIVDFDNGKFTVPRSQLTTAEFDVDMSPAPASLSNIPWILESTSYMAPYGTDGGIEVLSGASSYWAQAKSTEITGDFILEYKVTLNPDATNRYILLGYSKYDVPLGSDLTPERCAYFNPPTLTWTDADDAQADPWVNAMSIGPSSPLASTAAGQLYTVKFQRVGGLITATMNNGSSSATFTVESSYTGSVYPHIALWSATGSKLEYGKTSASTVDADTSLLLHFNGADLSTSVVDSSIYNRTVSMEGDARISTANYKFGGSSLRPSAVTTSANNYVKVNHDGNTLLGTGDFTIEFFMKDIPGPSEQRYIGGNTGTDVSPGFLIQGTPGGFWVGICNDSGNGWAFQDVFSPGNLAVFKHLALVKTGSVYKFFIDGVDTGMNRPVAGTNINFSNLRIGMYENANVAYPCTSFIDEVRISKVARYTSSFTPPLYEFGSTPAPYSNVSFDFISKPVYSQNPQGEIVSTLTFLSNNTSDVLFSNSNYVVPENGLELKMIANNGFLLDDAEFFGFCNVNETSFNGFYYASNISIPAFGINNILQSYYSYPSTSEVEFKIVIKLTETLFYVNGTLVGSFVAANDAAVVKIATRFNTNQNIKSCSIREL